MHNSSVSSNAMINTLWRFAERFGAKGVEFIVSIVLARILLPDDYGTIALVTVFTTVLNVFIDSGLGNALIQKKDADDLDFSTVFFANVIICLIVYIFLFIAAPFIAGFYQKPELTNIIRVLGFTLVIAGIKNVQQAYISRTMQFKKFFFATLGGTVGAAIVGIIMAYRGMGVWALVAQQIFNATMDTCILWLTVRWRPKLLFSFTRLKQLFGYGWKLLVSSLLDTVYNDLRQLIIGKLYTTGDLAYYNQGNRLPQYLISNVNTSIDSVLFPILSQQQDDCDRVRIMTRRAISVSSYIIAPFMIGFVSVAPSLIKVLLTDKWLPCVPFLRIFCITYLFYPIHTANLNAIKAMGRSDLFLKLEIAKKTVGMVLLLSTMRFGVMVMAYSLLVSSLLCQIINAWPNRKLLNYGYLEQLKDILPSILIAVIMGICVSFYDGFGFSDFVTLVIQVVAGGILYIGLSIVTKNESFKYLFEILKSYVIKRKS